MPRVSRKQAEQHHKDVVAAASRLFREHGINGVSVPGVMAEAGLTHGAFYGHFESKAELAAAACACAFDEKSALFQELAARHGLNKDEARAEFITRYTAKSHRDKPGLGCPVAALCGDMGRPEFEGVVRSTYVTGLRGMIEALTTLLSRRRKKASREEALANVSMLVGGLMLARATKGHSISEEILQAVRNVLLA